MNALAIRKTNHFAQSGQSPTDQLSDYFGKIGLCDNHINQKNDYSALNHYLDRHRIDTHCVVISTGCNHRAFADLGFSHRDEAPNR
jgi:hypothetical protein